MARTEREELVAETVGLKRECCLDRMPLPHPMLPRGRKETRLGLTLDTAGCHLLRESLALEQQRCGLLHGWVGLSRIGGSHILIKGIGEDGSCDVLL